MDLAEAAIATLRQIGEGTHRPCEECWKVHESWRDPEQPNLAPQWSAPDGHCYREMTPKRFAQWVLPRLLAGSAA